jgi:spore maturation protein A
MIHYIWVAMIVGGWLTFVIHGNLGGFQKSLLEGAAQAVTICLGLTGTLAFWMGMLRVAESAGVLARFAVFCKPFLRIIFPNLARNHPAFTWMASNVAANLLGMGSAATPMGIRAMQELQQSSPDRSSLTPEMCTFVIMNTAGVTLIPTTVIAMRHHFGAAQPDWVIVPSVIATAAALLIALLVDRLFRQRSFHL